MIPDLQEISYYFLFHYNEGLGTNGENTVIEGSPAQLEQHAAFKFRGRGSGECDGLLAACWIHCAEKITAPVDERFSGFTAHDLKAAAILTVTKSGGTARTLSKFRPNCPIIALTTDETTCHQLNLSWGIEPGLMDEKDNTDELIEHAIQVSLDKGYLKKGDLVVITAGVPLGISGTTNLLKVERVE